MWGRGSWHRVPRQTLNCAAASGCHELAAATTPACPHQFPARGCHTMTPCSGSATARRWQGKTLSVKAALAGSRPPHPDPSTAPCTCPHTAVQAARPKRLPGCLLGCRTACSIQGEQMGSTGVQHGLHVLQRALPPQQSAPALHLTAPPAPHRTAPGAAGGRRRRGWGGHTS